MPNKFEGFDIAFSNEDPVTQTVAEVKWCDEKGIKRAWIPESYQHRSMFTTATAVALNTKRIEIGLGVLNPFTRHPALIAMETASLDEISSGRVTLGIGAAQFSIRKYGINVDGKTAMRQMTEATEIIRELLAGKETMYRGERFNFSQPVRLNFKPYRQKVPIYFGAVNKKMLQLAGAIADGVYLGAMCSPGYIKFAAENVATGAKEAGKDPSKVQLCANVLTSVADNRESAWNAIPRDFVAYYLTRVEPIMRQTAGITEEEIEPLKVALTGNKEEAAKRLTDSMLEKFAVAGNSDDCIQGFKKFLEAGLKVPLAWYVIGPDKHRAIELIANEIAPALT